MSPTRPAAAVLTGLPPIAGAGARVLVLGSMPGGRSLALREYYANPGNRFWRVAGELLGFDARARYAVRTEQLVRRGVALWDVLAQCRRAGSLDAAIERRSEVPNDFAGFFRDHPGIRVVALNGGAAARAYRDRVPPDAAAGRRVLELPSTSGANAAWRFDRLLERWSEPLADATLDTPVGRGAN